MSDGKFLTESTRELVVKVIDDAIKLPFYFEPFDDVAIKALLKFVDKYADKVIPDNLDEQLNEAIVLALDGNLDEAIFNLVSIGNELVDIPLLDEDTEQQVGVDAAKLIVSFVKDWATKKNTVA